MFIHGLKIYVQFHLHPRHLYLFLSSKKHLQLLSFVSFPFPSSFSKKNLVIFILKMLLVLLFHFNLCFRLLHFLRFLATYLLFKPSFSKPLLYFLMTFTSFPFFLIFLFIPCLFPSLFTLVSFQLIFYLKQLFRVLKLLHLLLFLYYGMTL